MGMFLSYGPYNHKMGECKIGIERSAVENEAEVPIATKEVWTIDGMLVPTLGAADPAADLDAQITALQAAYSTDGQDLILHLPDGSNSSSTLLAANTLGGTRVTRFPSWPTNEGAERVTMAHFNITVEAEVALNPAMPILMAYKESLKFSGGLPVIGWIKPAVGLPVQQLWKQFDTFRVVQDGSATGYLFEPLIGVQVGIPIWPAAILPQMTSIDYESPERIGDVYKGYKVSWHYEFENVLPLLGVPTPWPLAI